MNFQKLFLVVTLLTQWTICTGQWNWASQIPAASSSNSFEICTDLSDNLFVTGVRDNKFILAKYDNLGTQVWLLEESAVTGRGFDVGTDAAGNVYVIGFFQSDGIFQGRSSSTTVTLTSTHTDNLFFVKYDNNGELQWVRQISGSNSNDYNPALVVNKNDEIIIAGLVINNGCLNYTESDEECISLPSGGSLLFLAKYNSNGMLTWVETAKNARPKDVTVNGQGKIYVSGEFSGSNTEFGGQIISSVSSNSFFLAKYTDNLASASFDWVRNGNGIDTGSGLANARCEGVIANDNDIYIIGTFDDELRFVGAPTTKTINSFTPFQDDIFLAKYDQTGNLIWAQNSGSTTDDDDGHAIALLSGFPIFTGRVGSGPLEIGGANYAGFGHATFIAQLNELGNARLVRGAPLDAGEGHSIAIGQFCAVYITGPFKGNGTFVPHILTGAPISNNNIFIARQGVQNTQPCNQVFDIGPRAITKCKSDPFPVFSLPPGSWDEITVSRNGGTPQVVNLPINPTLPGTYAFQAKYNGGCCIANDAITIIEIECPCDIIPDFTTQQISNCTYQFNDQSAVLSGTSIVGYMWNFGDGTTSINNNVTHTYLAAGVYNVKLIVIAESPDGCCVKEIIKPITVNCDPPCVVNAEILVPAQNGLSCSFTSTATVNPYTTIAGYQWELDGVIVSNTQNYQNTFPRIRKTYSLCLTVYGITDDGKCCEVEICRTIRVRSFLGIFWFKQIS